jgi:hypothetical protein
MTTPARLRVAALAAALLFAAVARGEEAAATADPRTLALLQLDPAEPAVSACRALATGRTRCLIGVRFATDERARGLAVALHDDLGHVVGLEREHVMDGGWRGHIRIVPALPVGASGRHLAWVAEGLRGIDAFFVALEKHGAVRERYRWTSLELAFMRSMGRTTPSAYAHGWRIAYNVSGSLFGSADAVRETLFHEIFHLNDQAHGGWSRRVLAPIYDGIVARCGDGRGGVRTACLRPFAPGDTMVRGGTYYAFQPGGGVEEYAAELAVRYHREQRDALAGKPPAGRPFKCEPEENGRAWRALVAEMFAGVDLVPSCTR